MVSERVKDRWALGVRWLAMVAGVITLALLLHDIHAPLTDRHAFRQTQTAIGVWWMLHGGSWYDYETPVLGAGWSIPFEFPLYQWIVAGLVRALGVPLDAAGRVVSFAWLLVGIWPVALLARSYRLPAATADVHALLLLASPVYLLWGHAFLIETQAVALCLIAVAAFREFVVTRRIAWLAVASVANALGMLTKITTALPFECLMAAIALAPEAGDRLVRRIEAMAALAGMALPGGVTFLLYTRHADRMKAANPIASAFRSSAPGMMRWNFGTLGQRFGGRLPVTILRAMVDVAGWLGPVLVPLLLWLMLRRPSAAAGRDAPGRGGGRVPAAIVAMLAAAWLLPMLVFVNLHMTHNYYQAGNAVFLVAALAVATAWVAERAGRGPAIAVIGLLLASQAARCVSVYRSPTAGGAAAMEREIGLAVQRATPEGSAILATGLDWSPVAPYYAGRKALMIAEAQDLPTIRDELARPAAHLAGLSLGAIVQCPAPYLGDAAAAAALAQDEAGMRMMPIGICRLYLPATRPAARA